MIIEVTDKTFPQQLIDNQVVVVDFWAPWCQPCATLAPLFDQLAEQFGERVQFVKANVDETSIALQYGVRGIPTLMAFKNGEQVGALVGAQSRATLAKFVESVL